MKSSPKATREAASATAARSLSFSGFRSASVAGSASPAAGDPSPSSAANVASPTGATGTRTRKRSWKACSASSVGTSLLAATTEMSGALRRCVPLSNSRSFKSVSSAFRMAELALNTSSRKAMPAVGRKPSVRRS